MNGHDYYKGRWGSNQQIRTHLRLALGTSRCPGTWGGKSATPSRGEMDIPEHFA